MPEYPAGRDLDARVAEHVMNLHVVAVDWPCGYVPDGCDYKATSFPDSDNHFYSDRGPVYVPEHGVWPPRLNDPQFRALTGDRVAIVNPVPFYSTNIVAAWTVVESITAISRTPTLANTRFGYWWDSAHLWACTAEEAALEICNAALEIVESR